MLISVITFPLGPGVSSVNTVTFEWVLSRNPLPVFGIWIITIYAGLSQYIGNCSRPVQAGSTNRKYIARDNIYE